MGEFDLADDKSETFLNLGTATYTFTVIPWPGWDLVDIDCDHEDVSISPRK
jgi:hypothetical protein